LYYKGKGKRRATCQSGFNAAVVKNKQKVLTRGGGKVRSYYSRRKSFFKEIRGQKDRNSSWEKKPRRKGIRISSKKRGERLLR